LIRIPAASQMRRSVVQPLVTAGRAAGPLAALLASTTLRAPAPKRPVIVSAKPVGAVAKSAHLNEEGSPPLLSQGLGSNGRRSRRLITATWRNRSRELAGGGELRRGYHPG
jgi:hypothetical protein